MRKLVYTELYI